MNRIKSAYYKPKRGEWIQPVRRGYKLACCDCGLVHGVDFRTKHKRVQFRVYRLTRATAAVRKRPHLFVPEHHANQLAAMLLKATGKCRIRVGDYIVRWTKPERERLARAKKKRKKHG